MYPKEDIVFVSGIGCSCQGFLIIWTPMECIPFTVVLPLFATGLKGWHARNLSPFG